ncbi:gamma-mobile-trio recombinase GmtY [Rugamonas brunnea]|uniref:gamma-mobile-trio recombinase GmtY n=1 Tax=Rugamonas brunnea TaxID=2758569 RepID=UPI002882E89C|nr:gamma-mobile-trio recombinase GmtY [Rugamonas brunnea]
MAKTVVCFCLSGAFVVAFVVVRGQVVSDNTGASVELPIILSKDGPILPLIDYCLTVRRSLAWRLKLVRAVKLFLEYLEVNAVEGEKDWRLFRNFANALNLGTADTLTGIDPGGLYWKRMRPEDSNYIITLLSDFFEWLGKGDNPRALKFNPQYAGNQYDQKIDQQAYLYRRNSAFLGHTWSGMPSRPGRVVRRERESKVPMAQPPAFPEDRIEELLFKGFKVAGSYNWRDMAITCLLLGGGLRVSEPFHLYVSDVQPHWDDPAVAFVAIHHPSDGFAPNDWRGSNGKRGTRSEYLAAEFGLRPRHITGGKQHAGWKNPALDDRWFMQVHWFPKEKYGTLFLDIWKRYLEQLVRIERSHPFAWVNLSRGDPGGIYTISSYCKHLQRAVERIGLEYGKRYGTTAHGPRHAFGRRARQGGVGEVILQHAMHHCSPESQKVYTQPELSEVTSALERAAQKISTNLTPLCPWGDLTEVV